MPPGFHSAIGKEKEPKEACNYPKCWKRNAEQDCYDAGSTANQLHTFPQLCGLLGGDGVGLCAGLGGDGDSAMGANWGFV